VRKLPHSCSHSPPFSLPGSLTHPVSLSQGDLLRVERILLDALEFNVTGPTAYAFLHLLTQVWLCGCGGGAKGGSVWQQACSQAQPQSMQARIQVEQQQQAEGRFPLCACMCRRRRYTGGNKKAK